MRPHRLRWLSLVLAVLPVISASAHETLRISTPMPPPVWALLERQLLKSNEDACLQTLELLFDERGYMKCYERWGADDGPDDAIETASDWPLLHALGASDQVLASYRKVWEGHLQQYTHARTTQVEFAKNGMYYKEFPVCLDWQHIGEGLSAFNLQGLSDPYDERFRQRVRRFAGFYLNEDPEAPNYDPKHKIIRSTFNGSRGPLLRQATALDWVGDPLPDRHFRLLHGEANYQEMLDHYRDYTDVVGDHPQNLCATVLAANAFMLEHEAKYRDWVVEYVNAWRDRTLANGGNIPSNIGLDGRVGSSYDGAWYSGVYGWDFNPYDPPTKKKQSRSFIYRGPWMGFANALLLTGDPSYLDVLRGQVANVYAAKKIINGQTMIPRMHGAQGWYGYTTDLLAHRLLKIYLWSFRDDDRARVPKDQWLEFLEGRNPGFPEQAMGRDFALVRQNAERMRADTLTPDTRLSDNALPYIAVNVGSLVQLMLGALPTWKDGDLLHAQIRYFDPERRRSGIPESVGALIDGLSPDGVSLTLVNLDQVKPRSVLVQAGAYAEHDFTAVTVGEKATEVGRSFIEIRLAPGAGSKITAKMKRYAHRPTLSMPWDRAR